MAIYTQTSASADHLTLANLRELVEATAHVDGSALVFGSLADDRLTYLPGNDDHTLARLVISTTPTYYRCEESGCRKDAAGRYEYRLLCVEHLAAAQVES